MSISEIMETSRERVLKSIHHIQPDIVPVYMMSIEEKTKWFKRFRAEDDVDLAIKLGLDLVPARVVYSGSADGGRRSLAGQPVSSVPVFGSKGAGYSQSRGYFPLQGAETTAEVDSFLWPNPDDFDYQAAAEALCTFPPGLARSLKIQYVIPKEDQSRVSAARSGGVWLPILCGVMDLFGMEETLINLHTRPSIIESTIAHLEEFILEFMRRALEATRGMVDIVMCGDDFSTQKSLLISPTHWRKFLKPTYRKMFALIKQYNAKVWFHSCGTFRPVLGDLIDIGMDIWETVQVQCPGNEPEVLKQEYGEHLTFYGAISTQTTLPYGSQETVRAEVRERVRVLGRGGGYICGNDHVILPDVPIENVLAMLDEAKKYRFVD
jgi:uroporphyrinogen decarboxylase